MAVAEVVALAIAIALAVAANRLSTLFASLMKLLTFGITNKFVLLSLTRNFRLLTFDFRHL